MSGRIEPVASDAWPTSMLELDPAESLIVWTLRRWALRLRHNAGQHWPLVSREFVCRFGEREGGHALAGFVALIGGLRDYGRRPLRHHQPCCPCLGNDELWLVCLLGACQRGERGRARLLAEWMVRADGIGGLLEAGSRLARILEAHHLILPVRSCESGRPEDGRPTVH